MTDSEILTGQHQPWALQQKLGEGDAGEVFLVESVSDRSLAILKRPLKSAFSGDVIRQASQIESEGKILRALDGLIVKNQHSCVKIPKIIDLGKKNTENTSQFFIVIERASGFDLKMLTRIIRFGQKNQNEILAKLNIAERFFLQRILEQGKVPRVILLRALSGLISFLKHIHSSEVFIDGIGRSGIIWNDIKHEHIFWDPVRACFTIIDWGNAQFLEANGTTRDRLFSAIDDQRQFVEEMGKFLILAAPDLRSELSWWGSITSGDDYEAYIRSIGEKVNRLLKEDTNGISNLRKREKRLLNLTDPQIGQLRDLDHAFREIIDFGEMPEFAAGIDFCTRLAKNLSDQKKITELRWLSEWARRLPGVDADKWIFLGRIAKVAAKRKDIDHDRIISAIEFVLVGDWEEVLWQIVSEAQDDPDPDRWTSLIEAIRSFKQEINPENPTPLEAVRSFLNVLEAGGEYFAGGTEFAGSELFGQTLSASEYFEHRKKFEAWTKLLRDRIIKKWRQAEPDPPDSNLRYTDVDRLLAELVDVWAEAKQALSRIIYQPGAQVEIVLDAWNRREFDVASRGLRRVLLWDPDRLRVLQAQEAIKATPDWLEKVQGGPSGNDKLSEYATHLELQGRELRNKVGRAGWLDFILAALKQFRQEIEPATIIQNQPELINEFPWLRRYEKKPSPEESSEEPAVEDDLEIQPNDPLAIDRVQNERTNDYKTLGIIKGKFGSDQSIVLTEALDTWKPEAQGSSARVFQGFIRSNKNRLKQAAIKIMRPDKIEYALPLFKEEANILFQMQDVPGITRMIECGFFQLDVDGNTRPIEVLNNMRSITGNVIRFGIDEIDRFLSDLDAKTEELYLPYLALEKRNNDTNLLTLCDAGHTQGKYLPVELGLIIGIQICDIMKAAHEKDIVYRDHKILHYYWQKIFNGVFVIDWNVSKWYPSGLTEAVRQFDIVQFGARALHHILTGRPAPGALPLGPTSPEEIEQASHQYSVLWTFDDQRLPQAVRDILERVLAGEFSEVEALKAALKQSLLITVDDVNRLI